MSLKELLFLVTCWCVGIPAFAWSLRLAVDSTSHEPHKILPIVVWLAFAAVLEICVLCWWCFDREATRTQAALAAMHLLVWPAVLVLGVGYSILTGDRPWMGDEEESKPPAAP